ncbi:MAG: hypothetical protein LBH29_01615 [Elusimicrobiota bacterium]|nr:hypothetical protein [Elusimicrobiota bacterium]
MSNLRALLAPVNNSRWRNSGFQPHCWREYDNTGGERFDARGFGNDTEGLGLDARGLGDDARGRRQD